MQQRVSLITLGVADVDRARAFYSALGWSTDAEPGAEVVFFQAGGLVFALWGAAELAADAGVDLRPSGGVVLAHNVGSTAQVDSVLAEAEAAGATIQRSGAPTFWGGYSGAFLDPDGHPWEVAHNPHWALEADGTVRLPGSTRQDGWATVDDYIADRIVPQDDALLGALRAGAQAGLPAIDVSPAQGRFLELLARLVDAHAILEIGTLGGYSTIWLARGLAPGGQVVSIEVVERNAQVARESVARAGLSDAIDIRVGAALEVLPLLEQEGAGPFDLVFIDADKPNTPEYFAAALRMSRPGTVIVADNVVRGGALGLDGGGGDPGGVGGRRLHDLIAAEPRVKATTIQTVGAKGYDGFTLALVV